eukprot:2846204-Pleurochrysis_carterae.AAC.1
MTYTEYTEAKGRSPNYWPDLIGTFYWHYLSKVCISPIQRAPIYGVSNFASQYYTPSDGFSTHDAHPDGYMVTIARHNH